MSIVIRIICPTLALAIAMSVMLAAASTSSSARAELQLELGDLLLNDRRYWESIHVYNRAKEGATPGQLERASAGLLQSLLRVGEFHMVREEADFLDSLNPQKPEIICLYADALWASGMFVEADQIYREVLESSPSSPGCHHGLARSLAARNQLESGLVEVHRAIEVEPENPIFHHTHGQILSRLRRFEEAAAAFERVVKLSPYSATSEQTKWARAQVRFLRSFGDRVPFEMSDEDVVHEIPFRIINDKIVVRARLNGGDPFPLVIDSGAEQMVLSLETAKRFGVRPIINTVSAGVGAVGLREIDMGRADSIQLGTFEVRNVPVLIKNPPLTGLPSTRVPDGLSPLALGMSVIIDYRNKRLTLARTLPDEPADVVMPMWVGRLAVIRGVVNGQYPRSFVVDTGGEVISISLGTARSIDTRPIRNIPLQVFGTSGWDEDAYLLPGVDLAFDEVLYENYPVVVLNLHRPSVLLGFQLGGILGHTFLSNYVVAMDINRSELRLKRY